eukprot:c23431_g1_i1 orf=106-276(+)
MRSVGSSQSLAQPVSFWATDQGSLCCICCCDMNCGGEVIVPRLVHQFQVGPGMYRR